MRKLRAININNILFLDIETAPAWEHFKDVPENVRKEWIYKFKFRADAPKIPGLETTENVNYSETLHQKHLENYEKYFAELWLREAGLYPEFSRIVCISYGYLEGAVFRVASSFQTNEKELLEHFCSIVGFFWERNKGFMICAHNGKGFDFPFMAKRLLFHRMELPMVLDTYGLKPWEITTQLDTLEIWKFGAFSGGGAGLPAIALHFGIPTPKDDIDGSQVSGCYHSGQLESRVVPYCEKDVVTLVQCFRAMRCEELLKDGAIQFTNN